MSYLTAELTFDTNTCLHVAYQYSVNVLYRYLLNMSIYNEKNARFRSVGACSGI